MNYKKLFGIGAICLTLLAMTVIAVDFANRDMKMEKRYKDALTSIGLTDYNVTNYDLSDGTYKRCLFKAGAIDDCTIVKDSTFADKWEKQRMEDIANATIQRQNKATETILSIDKVTITEKK